MTAVITGCNGFSSSHLADYLRSNRLASFIIGIDVPPECRTRAVDLYFPTSAYDQFALHLSSLTDHTTFFHLAGLLGNRSLADLLYANVFWTGKFLEAAGRINQLTCFLNVGSSAEYGRQRARLLEEELTPNPVTAYGVSKHLQSETALRYSEMFGLPVVCTRTFNLVGPGLSDSFMLGKMVSEFKKARFRGQDYVELGRLDSVRDLVDVRDAVEIYWKLCESGGRGEVYNVGSGSSYSVQEVFEMCCTAFAIRPRIVTRQAQPVASDVEQQFAGLEKLRRAIGKTRFIALEGTIRDMMQRSLDDEMTTV